MKTFGRVFFGVAVAMSLSVAKVEAKEPKPLAEAMACHEAFLNHTKKEDGLLSTMAIADHQVGDQRGVLVVYQNQPVFFAYPRGPYYIYSGPGVERDVQASLYRFGEIVLDDGKKVYIRFSLESYDEEGKSIENLPFRPRAGVDISSEKYFGATQSQWNRNFPVVELMKMEISDAEAAEVLKAKPRSEFGNIVESFVRNLENNDFLLRTDLDEVYAGVKGVLSACGSSDAYVHLFEGEFEFANAKKNGLIKRMEEVERDARVRKNAERQAQEKAYFAKWEEALRDMPILLKSETTKRAFESTVKLIRHGPRAESSEFREQEADLFLRLYQKTLRARLFQINPGELTWLLKAIENYGLGLNWLQPLDGELYVPVESVLPRLKKLWDLGAAHPGISDEQLARLSYYIVRIAEDGVDVSLPQYSEFFGDLISTMLMHPKSGLETASQAARLTVDSFGETRLSEDCYRRVYRALKRKDAFNDYVIGTSLRILSFIEDFPIDELNWALNDYRAGRFTLGRTADFLTSRESTGSQVEENKLLARLRFASRIFQHPLRGFDHDITFLNELLRLSREPMSDEVLTSHFDLALLTFWKSGDKRVAHNRTLAEIILQASKERELDSEVENILFEIVENCHLHFEGKDYRLWFENGNDYDDDQDRELIGSFFANANATIRSYIAKYPELHIRRWEELKKLLNYGLEPGESYIRGDLNNDGLVDQKDVELMFAFHWDLHHIPRNRILNADVNDDGVVDIVDAKLLSEAKDKPAVLKPREKIPVVIHARPRAMKLYGDMSAKYYIRHELNSFHATYWGKPKKVRKRKLDQIKRTLRNAVASYLLTDEEARTFRFELANLE